MTQRAKGVNVSTFAMYIRLGMEQTYRLRIVEAITVKNNHYGTSTRTVVCGEAYQ